MCTILRLLTVLAVALSLVACGDVLTSPTPLVTPRLDTISLPEVGQTIHGPNMPTWPAPNSSIDCRFHLCRP